MKQSTRDNLIYLGVGLGIVAVIVADLSYSEGHGLKMWLPSKFTLRAVYTTGLLGYFIARQTRRLGARAAQVVACVLFGGIVHLAVLIGLRPTIAQLSGILFAAFATFEGFLIVELQLQVLRYLTSG